MKTTYWISTDRDIDNASRLAFRHASREAAWKEVSRLKSIPHVSEILVSVCEGNRTARTARFCRTGSDWLTVRG